MTDSLRRLIGYQVRRASVAIMEDLSDSLEDLGLSPVSASVLMVIETNPGIKLIAIGRELGIKRSNVSPLVSKLEMMGLLKRMDGHGRSHALHLTANGKKLLPKVRKRMEQNEERFLGHMKKKDRDYLYNLLQSIRP